MERSVIGRDQSLLATVTDGRSVVGDVDRVRRWRLRLGQATAEIGAVNGTRTAVPPSSPAENDVVNVVPAREIQIIADIDDLRCETYIVGVWRTRSGRLVAYGWDADRRWIRDASLLRRLLPLALDDAVEREAMAQMAEAGVRRADSDYDALRHRICHRSHRLIDAGIAVDVDDAVTRARRITLIQPWRGG